MDHHFSVEVATEYGICPAILLENLNYWCEHNRANETHFYDGKYWTYNSTRAFNDLFPYMGDKQIRNALQKLKDEGLIETGNYNKNQYDRTLWYTITPKGQNALCQKGEWKNPKGQMEIPESANGDAPKGEPIPDNKPVDKPTDDKPTDTYGAHKRFAPPTVDDVRAYVQEKGYDIDAEQFVNFYESKGWMVGKNPMKNWRAAVGTWVSHDRSRRSGAKANPHDIYGKDYVPPKPFGNSGKYEF